MCIIVAPFFLFVNLLFFSASPDIDEIEFSLPFVRNFLRTNEQPSNRASSLLALGVNRIFIRRNQCYNNTTTLHNRCSEMSIAAEIRCSLDSTFSAIPRAIWNLLRLTLISGTPVNVN